MSEQRLLSVIVPVYGSEEILPETHRRLSAALTALGRSWIMRSSS